MKNAMETTNLAAAAGTAPEEDIPAVGWRAYLELTKPRLSTLSVITALVGYLAARPAVGWPGFLHVLIGTGLAAAGAAVLNQWLERETDARMVRTRQRPLPVGSVSPGVALGLGLVLSASGPAFLFFGLNWLAGLLGAATILIYVCLYTPLKRMSRYSLEVGALAGALPPLIGWAGAEGQISALGWVLFGILFFWQVPHFLAIAWIYRGDYAAVGFPMLTVTDATGLRAARVSITHCVLLAGVSFVPFVLGLATLFYFVPALLLCGYFLWKTICFHRAEDRTPAARKLFHASLFYLPSVMALLVLDRWLF